VKTLYARALQTVPPVPPHSFAIEPVVRFWG